MKRIFVALLLLLGVAISSFGNQVPNGKQFPRYLYKDLIAKGYADGNNVQPNASRVRFAESYWKNGNFAKVLASEDVRVRQGFKLNSGKWEYHWTAMHQNSAFYLRYDTPKTLEKVSLGAGRSAVRIVYHLGENPGQVYAWNSVCGNPIVDGEIIVIAGFETVIETFRDREVVRTVTEERLVYIWTNNPAPPAPTPLPPTITTTVVMPPVVSFNSAGASLATVSGQAVRVEQVQLAYLSLPGFKEHSRPPPNLTCPPVGHGYKPPEIPLPGNIQPPPTTPPNAIENPRPDPIIINVGPQGGLNGPGNGGNPISKPPPQASAFWDDKNWAALLAQCSLNDNARHTVGQKDLEQLLGVFFCT